MRHVLLAAALYLLFAGGSASAEEIWHEVRSGELTLVGNVSEGRGRELLADLLAFRHALARVLSDARPRESLPTQIYAFRDFASLAPFLPSAYERGAWASGYSRRGPVKNVIVLDAGAAVSSSRTLFHEYVHLVSSGEGRSLPFWFEEGLSELYATARLSEDSVEIGTPDARRLERLARGDLLPLDVLLRVRRDEPLASDPLFYAQSWLLVHYFVVGGRDGGSRALARYLARVAEGVDPVLALDATPDLEAYARRPSYETLSVAVGPTPSPDALGAARLSRGEVQHRWGELFFLTGRLAQARACLDAALRLEPELGPLRETLGLVALEDGDWEAAGPLFRAAMELGGATPSGLYLYARAVLRDYSGHFVESIPEPVAREAEEALRSSLRLKPAQSETARLLAFVYLVRGKRLREAEALVRGALLLDPSDPKLRYLEGQILARRGEYDRARDVLDAVIRDASDPALREAVASFLSRMTAVERAPGS